MPAGDLVNHAKLWVVLCYVYIKHYVNRIKRFFRKPAPRGIIRIKKILAFCEKPTINHSDVSDFCDITHWFDPTSTAWSEDMHDTFPQWDTWKIEIRFVDALHRKKRFVFRSGEELHWPPNEARDRLDTVLAAFLCSPEGEVNITSRLKKYICTPSNELYVHDLFPMDDHEANAEHHTGIRVAFMDSSGRSYIREYGYDEALTAKKM